MSSRTPLNQRLLPEGRLRRALRHGVLEGLSVAGGTYGQVRSKLETERVQFLYLHFFPQSDEQILREVLTKFKNDHEFVPYSRAVDLATNGSTDGGAYLSLSVDDGFLSNARLGAFLKTLDISACFFICPGLVGQPRENLVAHFPNSLGDEERALNWQEVERLLDQGHEIGNHTMTHPILSRLPQRQAMDQIAEARELLQTKVGTGEHFAWPCGQFQHFTDDLADFVFASGHTSCASAVRGSHSLRVVSEERSAQPCLRRENIDPPWRPRQIDYLMSRGAATPLGVTDSWPAGWRDPSM